MRLFEKFRPRSLAQVIGQPPVNLLRKFVRAPYPCCFILDGPPGTGKTGSAFALAHDLGCFDSDTWPHDNPPAYGIGEFTGLFRVTGDLPVDKVRELFGNSLRFRYGSTSGFNVLVIEELEHLSPQCQIFLRSALETGLPKNLVVVATTNSAAKIGKALLQRFKTYCFSGGPEFHRDSIELLYRVWMQLAPGEPAPRSLPEWGVDADGQFSMRQAYDQLEDHLSVLEAA